MTKFEISICRCTACRYNYRHRCGSRQRSGQGGNCQNHHVWHNNSRAVLLWLRTSYNLVGTAKGLVERGLCLVHTRVELVGINFCVNVRLCNAKFRFKNRDWTTKVTILSLLSKSREKSNQMIPYYAIKIINKP